MKPKTIKLEQGERVIAVVPERAAGRWGDNATAWVWIENSTNGKCRQECIQPEERTEALHALYDTGEAVHCALIRAIPFKRIKEGK